MGKSIHVITETRQEWSQRKSDEILVLNILLPLFFGFIFGAIIYFLTYNLIFTGIFFILGIFVYTKLYRLIFPKKGSRGKKQKSFSSKWVWIVLALVAIFLVWNNFSTLKEMIPSNTSPPNLNSYSSLSFEERARNAGFPEKLSSEDNDVAVLELCNIKCEGIRVNGYSYDEGLDYVECQCDGISTYIDASALYIFSHEQAVERVTEGKKGIYLSQTDSISLCKIGCLPGEPQQFGSQIQFSKSNGILACHCRNDSGRLNDFARYNITSKEWIYKYTD